MNTTLAALIVLGCLVAAVLSEKILRRLLPVTREEPNGYATFQRNKVWNTEETLWRDVTIKSPRNPRGLMNYGNTLMTKAILTARSVTSIARSRSRRSIRCC